MEFFLAIGAFAAFTLAWILSIKKGRNKADRALSILFVVNGLTILLGFLEVTNRKAGYPFAFILHTSTPLILLHGPLMWMYVNYLTRPAFRLKPIHLFHLVPFVLVLAMFVLKNYVLPADQRIAEEETEAFRQTLMFPLVVLVVFVSTQSYYWYNWFKLRRHRRNLEGFYGNLDHKDLGWLKRMLMAAIIFYATISLLYIADYLFVLMPYGSLQAFGYLFAAVYTGYLGWYGFKQGEIFTGGMASDTETGFIAEKTLPSFDSSHKEIAALTDLMAEKKLHTDPELTLASLAKAAGMTPMRLSALLNQQMGMTFFEFVNRCRVDEFKQQALSDEGRKLSLMGIAYNCGFNSKPTFNRVFRSLTGKTPSQWLAEQKK